MALEIPSKCTRLVAKENKPANERVSFGHCVIHIAAKQMLREFDIVLRDIFKVFSSIKIQYSFKFLQSTSFKLYTLTFTCQNQWASERLQRTKTFVLEK